MRFVFIKIYMNTIIIENADKESTALFKQLAMKLGLYVKTKVNTEQKGVITNPDLLERIKRIEEGKAELINTNVADLKKLV